MRVLLLACFLIGCTGALGRVGPDGGPPLRLPDGGLSPDAGETPPDGGSGPTDAGLGDAGGYQYSLPATLDTYIRADLPSNNNGTFPYLVLTGGAGPVKSGLLRFDVGGGSITRAVLHLFASNGSASGFKIYRTDADGWNAGTTQDNAPSTLGALLAEVTDVPSDGGFDVDLTSAVVPHQALSMELVASSSDGLILNSSEAPASAPLLTVSTSDLAPLSCLPCSTGETCASTTGLCRCTPTSCGAGQQCSVTGHCATPVKVMQFNILDGGSGQLSNGVSRIDADAAIINAVAPDVVTIDEANIPPNFDALVSKTGMHGALCMALNGYHVGILSKKPFSSTQCATPSPITKTVNIVGVPVGSKTLYVVAAHLTATPGDAGEAYRVSEMEQVLQLAQVHANEPRLIMGDFNSSEPAGAPSGSVTPLLTDAHYVDSYREVHWDVAAFPGVTGVGGQARIDYIFHDPLSTRASAAETVTSYSPWPSDHYAVWAVIEVF